ncbi:MAG TPA: gephyrin-like molybdotransferase Glp [Actinomycetota bacterium]|nr:gephyrin-like molybdotransferase Glp [Actinomycetota bacterium]
MPDDLLTVDEARARVLDSVAPVGTTEVLLRDALGLVVAADAIAPHDLPRFDNSAMDGYAVRADDVAGASPDHPSKLKVIGEVRAGDPGELKVLPGTASRIMTGAPVPAGADAIVRVEDTVELEGYVLAGAAMPRGMHVRPAGDDITAGQVVVRAGTELGPGELAVLASMGLSPLAVRRGPKVALLVTGDELVDPEAQPAPGQIRDSNSVALSALIREAGADLIPLGRIEDKRDSVRDAFERAAALADLVVSSGGVAVGRYDFVKDVVEELGAISLWRVAMQPGKPVVLGQIKDTPFLGLPGNPVSIHVGFEQFVRPAIRKMRGCASLLRPVIRARLEKTIEKIPGRLHFVRVRLAISEGEWTATPTGPQGSHIQSSLVGCHGVARFARELDRLDAGTEVEVEVWRLPGAEE